MPAERRWFTGLQNAHAYAARLLEMFLSCLDELRHLPDEEVGFLAGKVAIADFLEVLNVFDQTTSFLVEDNVRLGQLVDDRINEKVAIVNESWDPSASGKSKKTKADVTRSVERKRTEAAFVRDTLWKHEFISDEGRELLGFAWKVRNSIHNNYCATSDIDFEWDDQQGKHYVFHYRAGDELSHPDDDVMAFSSIVERMQFIGHEVIAGLQEA